MKRYGKIAVLMMLIVFVLINLAGFIVSLSKADVAGRDNFNDLKYVTFYSLSGSNPYVRFNCKYASGVYDPTDTTDYINASATWTNTDVDINWDANIGGWPLTLPETLPNGSWDLLVYDVSVADGARSSADTLKSGFHILVKSGRVIQMTGY